MKLTSALLLIALLLSDTTALPTLTTHPLRGRTPQEVSTLEPEPQSLDERFPHGSSSDSHSKEVLTSVTLVSRRSDEDTVEPALEISHTQMDIVGPGDEVPPPPTPPGTEYIASPIDGIVVPDQPSTTAPFPSIPSELIKQEDEQQNPPNGNLTAPGSEGLGTPNDGTTSNPCESPTPSDNSIPPETEGLATPDDRATSNPSELPTLNDNHTPPSAEGLATPIDQSTYNPDEAVVPDSPSARSGRSLPVIPRARLHLRARHHLPKPKPISPPASLPEFPTQDPPPVSSPPPGMVKPIEETPVGDEPIPLLPPSVPIPPIPLVPAPLAPQCSPRLPTLSFSTTSSLLDCFSSHFTFSISKSSLAQTPLTACSTDGACLTLFLSPSPKPSSPPVSAEPVDVEEIVFSALEKLRAECVNSADGRGTDRVVAGFVGAGDGEDVLRVEVWGDTPRGGWNIGAQQFGECGKPGLMSIDEGGKRRRGEGWFGGA